MNASIPWEEQEIEIIKSFVAKGYTSRDIKAELNRNGFDRTKSAIRNKALRMRLNTEDDSEKVVDDPLENIPQGSTAITAIGAARDAATLGLSKWHTNHSRVKLNRATKVLSLSDLHIPFFYTDAIEQALSDHKDADVIVLNGDLLEVDMASKYPRQKTVLLKYEYKLALDFIKRISEQFPNVVIVKGNHEYRLDRYFQSKVEPGLNFMVEGDILWRLSEGYGFDDDGHFEKRYDFNNVSYSRGLTNWFVQIGQAIFCHPWRSSSMSLRSVEIAHQWFMERGFSYDAVIMGHSHRSGLHFTGGKLLIEQGCLCVPLEYASRADIQYRPTTFGYAVVIMDKNGNVDFNESRPIYYGTGATTPTHVVSGINGQEF